MSPESALTGLDQLQNLRTQTTSPSLTIERLQNESGCSGELSRICTLPGLPITDLCTMEQMETFCRVHRRGRMGRGAARG